MTLYQTICYCLMLAREFDEDAQKWHEGVNDNKNGKFRYANQVRANCYRHAAVMMGKAVGINVKVKER